MGSSAFYAGDVQALSGDNGSEVLTSTIVSDAFFSTLEGPFAAGRPLDGRDDTSPSVVISERLARRLFRDAEHAIGQRLTLTSTAYSVVGVAARAFQFPSADVDVWLPGGFIRSTTSRCCGFRVVARLKPEGTIDRARAVVQQAFQTSTAGRRGRNSQMRTRVVGLPDSLVASVRPALLVLPASVSMVLIIACGNLINLLLARNAARAAEFAVRRALGASASRLMRQLLVESGVLAVVGAACGIVLARPTPAVLSRLPGDALPRADAIQLDLPAMLFAVCIAALAAMATGIVPAMRAESGPAIPAQSLGNTAIAAGAKGLRRTMCVVQVALATILLVGATLLGRSLAQLLHVDLGVATDHVLTASLTLSFGQRPTDAQTLARVTRAIDDIRGMPGVRAAGVGTSLPPSQSRMTVTLRRQGDAVDYQASAVSVTPGYFSALHMRLLKGRFFTEADDGDHPAVIIVSEDTAKRLFDADDPLGRSISLPLMRDGKKTSADMTVVGVTSNVKYAGLAAPADDIVYRPFAQQPWVAAFLMVRTAGDPAEFASALRRRVAAVDASMVITSVTPLDQLVEDAVAQPHFRTVLLASLAGMALAIATMGLYGVVAYAVSLRTKEIGIRVALGATSQDVLGMVLRDGMVVAIAGIGAGIVCALMLTRLLAGLLYGIAPTGPLSFVLAAGGLFVVTLAASYVPARRAERVNAIVALRTE